MYLVPACVLIGFGLGLVIPGVLDLPADTAGPVFRDGRAGPLRGFPAVAGSRAPLALAGIIAVVALADLFLQIDLVPLALQPYFVPVVLVIVGVYLLVEPQGVGPATSAG